MERLSYSTIKPLKVCKSQDLIMVIVGPRHILSICWAIIFKAFITLINVSLDPLLPFSTFSFLTFIGARGTLPSLPHG